MTYYAHKPLSIFLSTFVLICSIALSEEATNNGGITVDLIHRDSPFSPSYNPSETQFERRMNSFRRSVLRSIHLGHLSNTSSAKPSAEAPITPYFGEYLMKILIGTPPVEVVALVSTGSDLTWIQCSPCTKCYKQKPPLFDPTKSRTYQNISCGSEQCGLLEPSLSLCDSDPKDCRYLIAYGGGTTSIGDIASETFTFDSNVEFPNVVFGCSHQYYGDFPEAASGLVGLGGASSSIVRQLEKSISAKFSYCLTSPDSNVSSKINFGSNAVVEGPKVVSTPLKNDDRSTYFSVGLEGFSVGNKKLEYIDDSIPKSNSKQSTTENIILDTGTTFTTIPRWMYDELESAVVEAVKGYKRVDDPRGAYGLCYESPENGQISPPVVTAHFEGADVVLPPGSIFVEAAKGVVCLTLVPGAYVSYSIFGNIHQTNYLVGFDLDAQKVNFLPTDCSKAPMVV